MNTSYCPHCEELHFATLCSDCLAEEIHIQQTKSGLHIGRCHRCDHVDAEPCPAPVASRALMVRSTQITANALKGVSQKAINLAARTANAIKGNPVRTR